MNSILFHVPHSSLKIPKQYWNICVKDKKYIKNINIFLSDYLTDKLIPSNCHKLVFRYSRLFCDVEKFKDDFGRNYNLASKKFKTAIEEIDKTIDHLQKTKDALLSSDKNLRIANEKIDSVTIKKLTHNNKSVQNMFANLKKDKNQVANILSDEIKLNSKNDNGKNDTVN